MSPSTLKRLEVIATAVGAAIVVRGAFLLFGVDLDLKEQASMDSVGVVDVLVASILAGFGAWGVHALLVRQDKARYWPFVASTVLAISMTGPGYLADGTSAVALMALHFAVAVPLIVGFAKLSPETACEPRSADRPGRVAESGQR